ncbi:MAG: transketolase family protein [Syntrophomonadaceae bacterium]|nr:transketolase family protein [Syntrophomonadaceae bacterium]
MEEHTMQVATRDAYGQALKELGEQYPDVVVLDADLSKSTKTVDFARAFPDRFFDMGIAEQNMMAVAAGLAASGKVVFASTFAIFATGRAYEQIRNSVAYAQLNVKVCATHAGITVGEDGSSHQSVEDIALMRVIPNMKVVVPADGPSTAWAVRAIYHQPGPVYLRMGRPKVPVVYDSVADLKIGQSVKLRDGGDVGILACGIMVSEALQAAAMLAEKGIEATVLDVHTIKPLDRESILETARKTGCLVTAEEHSIIGGLGGAVSELTASEYPVPVVRVGVRDLFGQSGNPRELMEYYGLTAQEIANAAQISMSQKG